MENVNPVFEGKFLFIWRKVEKQVGDLIKAQIYNFFPGVKFSTEDLNKQELYLSINKSDFMGIATIYIHTWKRNERFGKTIKITYNSHISELEKAHPTIKIELV